MSRLVRQWTIRAALCVSACVLGVWEIASCKGDHWTCAIPRAG